MTFELVLEGHQPLTGTLEELQVAEWPKWAWVKHDYELEGVWDHDLKPRTYPDHTGKPETVTTLNKASFTPMDRGWAEYWFKNYAYQGLGYFPDWLDEDDLVILKERWSWLTKGTEVITNDHGTDKFYDPVTGGNPGKEVFGCDGLLMGGQVIRITGPKQTIKGEPYYPFDHFDGSQPPPNIGEVNCVTHPWRFTKATVCRWEEEDVGYRVDPFPQLWSPPYNGHTLLLSVSKTQNWVRSNRIFLLDDIEYPQRNAYNPARVMNYD